MDAQLTAPEGVPSARVPRHLSLGGDERLARLVGHGSEPAFAELYRRYHQRLYRYCRSILRNDADAQDALQSAFARAFMALARGQRDAPMRPWLYRIAHNESVSMLRRRRPEVTLSQAQETPSPSAEDVAGERERLAVLVTDLGELSERQRGALVMRELSGLSHEDIALALGISVGAAKQTIFEARQSLAEFAEGRAMRCEEVCRAISDGNRRTMRGRRFRAHLRDCSSCGAFATSISSRSADLQALAPPLSAVAATGLLKRALDAGSGHGGHGAGIATGAGKAAGVVLAAKSVAGAAIVAAAAIGVSSAIRHVDHPGARAGRPTAAAIALPLRRSSPAGAQPVGELQSAGAGADTRARRSVAGHRSTRAAHSRALGRASSTSSNRARQGAGPRQGSRESSAGLGHERAHGRSSSTVPPPRRVRTRGAPASGARRSGTASSSTRARRRRPGSTRAKVTGANSSHPIKVNHGLAAK